MLIVAAVLCDPCMVRPATGPVATKTVFHSEDSQEC